jgi:hypothetical protein
VALILYCNVAVINVNVLSGFVLLTFLDFPAGATQQRGRPPPAGLLTPCSADSGDLLNKNALQADCAVIVGSVDRSAGALVEGCVGVVRLAAGCFLSWVGSG